MEKNVQAQAKFGPEINYLVEQAYSTCQNLLG